ncbi:complement decay-accelerating factor [Ammospiza nelsoni]|uniref:complement decay-accelerating factor n=1 Tax=Ammospiza nelsoni TaxID=2857394 RepID=UPI00286B289B|nr:complement decay-accelerating factor [Ammospiza nelsoni]
MTAAAAGWGAPPDPPSCGVISALLLALLGLLGIPVAHGDCGPPPAMTHSSPSSSSSSFPVGSRVTFSCSGGARRIPGMPDTVECLPGDIWSRLAEPCGRSCAAPTRLRFAALSKEDERRNFFPVGANISYVCRPGYENSSEISPSSTCLENLTWSQPAELCRRRSCGTPGALPGGKMGPLRDLQLGARVEVSCEDGYKLVGNNFIWCQLKGNDVEWSKLPTCELITCPPPPPISHGRHDGEGIEIFAYNSTVTYSCEPSFQLVGNGSIQCGSRDKTSGLWSGATPECKEKSSAVRLGAKDTESRAPPKSAQGNGAQHSQKGLLELMHSQEKLDVVEVLVLQIPHPLQRIISSMKRENFGFVGRIASQHPDPAAIPAGPTRVSEKTPEFLQSSPSPALSRPA